jgi:hypothetical protein
VPTWQSILLRGLILLSVRQDVRTQVRLAGAGEQLGQALQFNKSITRLNLARNALGPELGAYDLRSRDSSPESDHHERIFAYYRTSFLTPLAFCIQGRPWPRRSPRPSADKPRIPFRQSHAVTP